MEAAQRREWILKELSEAKTPQSATKLARQLGVSRQICRGGCGHSACIGQARTGNPARLCAANPAGGQCHGGKLPRGRAGAGRAVHHCGLRLRRSGCHGRTHPVYGEMCAPLQIFSREEAEDFVKRLEVTQPLCCLTGGVHLHRLQCPTPAHEQRVLKALQGKGLFANISAVPSQK